MSKYFSIFIISWQNEFTYRLNFILWRARNLFKFLMAYFLWSGVFLTSGSIFGYAKEEMLTYVFLSLVVVSFVRSTLTDNIGGEISNGSLNNYLIKPVSYLGFWFSRDIANKFLNLLFSIIEVLTLYYIFRPNIVIPSDLTVLLAFVLSIIMAIGIYYCLNVTSRLVAFWAPENTWSVAFLMVIFVDTLSGGVFPLDILPENLQIILQLTPFPYLVYFPIAIYLGRFNSFELLLVLIQSFIWLLLCYILMRYVFSKGVKNYASEGG